MNNNLNNQLLIIIEKQTEQLYKLLNNNNKINDNNNEYYLLQNIHTRKIIKRKTINSYKTFYVNNYITDIRTNKKIKNCYVIYCNYCNKYHYYKKLGKNYCHCKSKYSPYKLYGINIIFYYNNILECLLFNYKEYIKPYKNIYYYNYFKNFIEGNINIKYKTNNKYSEQEFNNILKECNKYAIENTPYFNYETIKYIRKHFAIINKKLSNGGLVASIKIYIEMMEQKKLKFFNYINNKELKDLIIFYKK